MCVCVSKYVFKFSWISSDSTDKAEEETGSKALNSGQNIHNNRVSERLRA